MRYNGRFEIPDREKKIRHNVSLYTAMFLSRGLLELLLKTLTVHFIGIIHLFNIMSVHDTYMYEYDYMIMCAMVCLHVYACACVCLCVSVLCTWKEGERNDRYLLPWCACGTGIILRASPLLGNASECPREMSPFHTDNRIWSKQKLPLQPIYSSLPVPPLILITAWNTNKRYISGLLAGDKRYWNRKSLGHSVPFSFSITNCSSLKP